MFIPITLNMIQDVDNIRVFMNNVPEGETMDEELFTRIFGEFAWLDLAQELLTSKNNRIFQKAFDETQDGHYKDRTDALCQVFIKLYNGKKMSLVDKIVEAVNR